jgi:PEP-CTERM motif-containing protein
MHALARFRPVIVRCALVLAGVATLGGTVVLLSFGLPAASSIRKGVASADTKPDLEKVAARATVADQHARVSTVPVDDIERVQQQFAAFVSSGQLPEVSLAEIPDLGFAIDDSTFGDDPLKAVTEVTGDLDAAEPQLAHLSPSLTSLVGGAGGGFGGGGGGGAVGAAGRGTSEFSASEGHVDGQSVQAVGGGSDQGRAGGSVENGNSSSGSSANNGSTSSGSAGSATNGSGPSSSVTSTPRGGPPAGGPPVGGPADSAPGRVGGVSTGTTVASVPEPSSMLLIGLGLAGAAVSRRFQRAH